MGDFIGQMGKRTNPSETVTGKFGLGLRNERGDTLIEWATSRKHKIMNTMFQKKAGRRWSWKSPNGVTKTEINYTLTNRPYFVTYVTVINKVNNGSDHRLVINKIKLNRKEWMIKTPPRVYVTRIRLMKVEFQCELINRFDTLQELNDIDTMSETITYMIQQRACRVTKAINKLQ